MICFPLLRQWTPQAFSFAFVRAGKSMAARMAIMAMTTSSSIKVKPREQTREAEEFGGADDSVFLIKARWVMACHGCLLNPLSHVWQNLVNTGHVVKNSYNTRWRQLCVVAHRNGEPI